MRAAGQQLSAPNLYLYAVLLKERGATDDAKKMLIEALQKMPLLWSAWLELAGLLKQEGAEPEVIGQLINKHHWILNFWRGSYNIEMNNPKKSFDYSLTLMPTFKDSVFIMNMAAHASYISQEYDEAINFFERLLKIDPYRYENLDLYSNILYIRENYGALATLAYRVTDIDKYRPEACCVVGNYYSLRGDHQKSALYFMRAIKLDRNFISAWTLMGHEYLEMKNTSAAIESYRTAVDTDPSDFRAWYGLGQAYELTRMH